MTIDLASLPHFLIEDVLSKMSYESLAAARQASGLLADIVDRRRRFLPVFRNVFALQFQQNKKAFIRPTSEEKTFLQDPETFPVEFPFLRPEVVAFNSLDMAEAIERVQLVSTRGIELIVDNLTEATAIHLASVLLPRLFYSQDIEFNEEILQQPGFKDLESIHIKSPQESIDLSPCGVRTKELVVDMSYADCPHGHILRLLKLWECGLGSLSRMELQFDNDFQSVDLCADIIEQCAADPIFVRELHEEGPLSDVDIGKFNNPHFDRLMVVSNRSFKNPQAAVILFQRGKFIFEATESFSQFYEVLNNHGNAVFVDSFRLDFRDVVMVQQQEGKRG